MLGEVDLRKDSRSIKFKWRPQIFVKLSFRDLSNSKLSGLHPSDKTTIIHWVKNRIKKRKIGCDSHWELICHNKWNLGTSEISTPLRIALGTHFHVWYGTKTIPVFLHANREASWLLLPSLVSLLSGSTMQPENTYSCILKVTVQIWESQERTSINSNHSYHQHLPKPGSTNLTWKSDSALTNPVGKDRVQGWSV